MATITEKSGTGILEIDPRNINTAGTPELPAKYTDEDALSLVTQDAAKGDAWLANQQWAMRWREAEVLYQSPRSTQNWEGAAQTRSNVSRYTVAKHVNSVTPQMDAAMFYDDPFFLLRPLPGTSEEIVRMKTALFQAVFEEMNFQTEVNSGFEGCATLGTMIFKWGVSFVKKIEKTYRRKNKAIKMPRELGGPDMVLHIKPKPGEDPFEVEEKEKEYCQIWFEEKDVKHIITPPGWRQGDITKAKWVIERSYPTYNDLDKLRNDPSYDIPDKETLKMFFAPPKETAKPPGQVEMQQSNTFGLLQAQPRDLPQTADPLEQPLEMLERVDNGKVITVLNGKLVIRNEDNVFGRVNYLSSNWWNVRGAGHGLGLGQIVGQDQRVDTGITNAGLDMLSMWTNQQALRSRGANIPTQQIRQRLGGILDVDGDIEKAFKWMDGPRIPPELFGMLQISGQEAEGASGSNAAMGQGQLPARGRAGVFRTATGANEVSGANASRLQGPMGRFERQVFLPFLSILDELITEYMSEEQVREILGKTELKDEDGNAKSFEQYVAEIEKDGSDFMEKFMNAKMRYEALAGAHLAARKGQAQFLPMFIQMIENPQIIQQENELGRYIDTNEVMSMLLEVSEWRNRRDIFKTMTPQMKQNRLQSQQAQSKMAGQAQLENQKHKNKSDEIDQKSMNDVGAQALTHTLRLEAEHNMEPLVGEGGGAQ